MLTCVVYIPGLGTEWSQVKAVTLLQKENEVSVQVYQKFLNLDFVLFSMKSPEYNI